MQKLQWLTVCIDKPGASWPPDAAGYAISLKESSTLPDAGDGSCYRCSPIFPFRDDAVEPNLKSCNMYFYCFDSAFSVLGRLGDIGSRELVVRLWYSLGLASVILITDDLSLNEELLQKAPHQPRDKEVWEIRDAVITKIVCEPAIAVTYDLDSLRVPPYASLPPVERSVIDEFVATIAVIVPKVATHMPNRLETFPRVVAQISRLISELIWINDPKGTRPDTLAKYTEDSLRNDAFLRERIANQDIDRIIQVNSSLSYVCTQMLSGAVPILERRGLIRRHSLLGIATAIVALSRMSHSIEDAFSEFSVEHIIVDRMADAPPLPGLEGFPEYDHSEWTEYSVNHWRGKEVQRPWYPKLPHFSGRLGFRETEYTISAALQSLTAGGSMEWSLLTLTHELLHGHVRNILSEVFRGDPNASPEERRTEFYQRFRAFARKEELPSNELESLRVAVLGYCCLTNYEGSLTADPNPNSPHLDVILPVEEELWSLFEHEYRNISEILVHVLDLHYFYGSRLSAYVPLIWRSWASVPHVAGDLRQYVLRTLLAISSKVDGAPYARFLRSVRLFDELLSDHIGGVLDTPTLHSVISYLRDRDSMESLVYPFRASLIIADIANNVFVSHAVRAKMMADPLATIVNDPIKAEDRFEYALPDGFADANVTSVTAYLLSRVLRQLEQPADIPNIEAKTAELFLACCSQADL